MPEISRFYGIVIRMYFADHAPPHFHAEYAEHEARVAIETLGLLSGQLPPRALGLVAEWATIHQDYSVRFGSGLASSNRSAKSRHCLNRASGITSACSRRRPLQS